MQDSLGKILIFLGSLLIIAGILFYCFGDKLNWIGRLPGDIRIEKENFTFYFPITTIIVFSLIINILIRIFRQFV